MNTTKKPYRNFFSLRILFPIFIGVFTLFLILIFGYTSYQVSRKALTDSLLDSFTREAHLAKTQMLDFLNYQVKALRVIEKTPPITAIFRAADNGGEDPKSKDNQDTWKQRLEQIMTSYMSADRASNLMQLRLLDKEGKELVRINRVGEKITRVPETELQDKSDYPYFQETIKLEEGQYYVSPINLNWEMGHISKPYRPTFRVAIPVFDEQASHRGILVANLNPRPLFDLLTFRPMFGNTYLINQNGDFLIHPDPEKTFDFELGFNYKLIDEHPDLASLLSSREEYISSAPSREVKHQDHFDGFIKIQYNPTDKLQFWAFVYDVSADKVLAPVNKLRKNLIILAVAVIAVFTSFGYVLNRRFIVAPIIMLSNATQKVADGDYSMEISKTKRRDEIGVLAESFNQMVENIKQSRAKLETSEESYRTLIETAVDPVIVVDELSRVLLWNNAATQTFGFTPNEMLNQNIDRIYSTNKDYKLHQIEIHRFLKTGNNNLIGITKEIKGRHKNGHLVDLLLSISSRQTEDGWIFTGIIKDNTEIKKARIEIERLAGFPRENPLPVVEINSEGSVTYVNPAGLRLVRRMKRETADIYHILPSDYKKLINESLHHGAKIPSREVNVDNLTFLWTGHLLKKFNAVHFYAADITELKETEKQFIIAKEQAETSDRLKSNFLGTMSHEVRTPLNVMLGYLDLLASSLGKKLTEEEKDFIETIKQNSDRLKRLIDDILDLSLIESEKTALQSKTFPGDKLVKNSVSEILRNSIGKEISIIEKYKADGKMIFVDDLRFQQAIINILNNAIKFTKIGEIIIETKVVRDEYHVSVSDTGIGIKDSFKPHLFSLFRQAEEGYNRSYEGAGLGLTISQRLVEAMKGRIQVESEEGHGSTFTIIFPLVRRNNSQDSLKNKVKGTKKMQSTPINGISTHNEAIELDIPLTGQKPISDKDNHKKGKLLILEDNPANLKYTEFLVKRLELEFISAESGEAALHLLKHDSVDGMLIDISLAEGMSGVEFMKIVKKLDQFRETPVIAVTAHAMKGQKEKFIADGFNDYMSKPFVLDDLRKVLMRNIKKIGLN